MKMTRPRAKQKIPIANMRHGMPRGLKPFFRAHWIFSEQDAYKRPHLKFGIICATLGVHFGWILKNPLINCNISTIARGDMEKVIDKRKTLILFSMVAIPAE
ncbi:MAG: hypothetical protein ABSB40_02580 [Nitrososphaeria archaeon]|jgi:hypothetical protein